jgi:endonuclease/exonuclease/phosphatase family metal-dependent hydrolase
VVELSQDGWVGGMKSLRTVLLVATIAACQACASAINYDDPAGPVLVGQVPSAPHRAPLLRVVTFNLKFGRQVDAASTLLSQSGPLADADLVLLQEVDGPGTEQIARTLGMNYTYVPSAVHPMSRRDFGVAILARGGITDARKLSLPYPHHLRRMRRAAATAVVDSPVGPLRVYAVHFETVFGAADQHRRAQARAVLADAAGWQGPTLIGGDFNGTDAADEFGKAGFTWLTRHVHNTMWLFDFDHFSVRGLCPAGNPPAGRGPAAHGVSDHRPVWALLQRCAGA